MTDAGEEKDQECEQEQGQGQEEEVALFWPYSPTR
jgi:hypothetical protein